MAVTLSSLRTQVRERADMQNSLFVSDSELNLYINNSAWELYDIVVSKFEDQFIYTDSITGLPPTYTITDTAQNWFTLPSNFYKLRGVDRQKETSGDSWFTLSKWNFAERNSFLDRGVRSYWGSSTACYRVLGQKVSILPQGDSAGTYRLWYIPKMTEMTVSVDLDPSIEMWSEYVVVDSAIKCLIKEESDTSMLMAIKQGLLDRIESMSANRDAGSPEKIANVRGGFGYGASCNGEPWD
jgi:hypothetical protein